jgi:hypothetical protein
MKTGRPGYLLPSPTTLARDVHVVYDNAKQRISTFLQVSYFLGFKQGINLLAQEYDGRLSLATDCWTSPNHKAFLALTVHFIMNATATSLILDVVELPVSHTGENLSTAIAAIVTSFGIQDKVSVDSLSS